MHKTRVPLKKWFWAIFFVSHDKRGISAVRLQEELGVSYPTAWLMLHKIRKAMGDRDARYQLAGMVEVDDTYFGGPKSGGKRGRGTEKTSVIVAVSLDKKGKPAFTKTAISPNLKSDTLVAFAEKHITEGSTMSSDAYGSYAKAFSTGKYPHEPLKFDPKEEPNHLRWLHTFVSNVKAFILGTYHGLDDTHFQAYLDEFCFRANRRFFRSELFDRLLYACSVTMTITYKKLVSIADTEAT
jgi:transposase-like protein